MQDAVKTMYLLEKCSTSDMEMTEDELTEMASLMMKLTKNSDWNNDFTTEFLFQTRTIQQNAESIGRKVLVDARYRTGIILAWMDTDTERLLDARTLYLRYHCQFHELSACSASTFMHPYLKSMLRLKIIAEEQSQISCSKRSQQRGKGKKGSKGESAASKPSVQLDKHSASKRGSHPQTVIDSTVD